MKYLSKIYLITFLVCADLTAFAAGPGDNDGGGGLEGGDTPPAAPINSKLIILAFLGIIYVIYTFRRNKRIV